MGSGQNWCVGQLGVFFGVGKVVLWGLRIFVDGGFAGGVVVVVTFAAELFSIFPILWIVFFLSFCQKHKASTSRRLTLLRGDRRHSAAQVPVHCSTYYMLHTYYIQSARKKGTYGGGIPVIRWMSPATRFV